MQFVLLIEIN